MRNAPLRGAMPIFLTRDLSFLHLVVTVHTNGHGRNAGMHAFVGGEMAVHAVDLVLTRMYLVREPHRLGGLIILLSAE